MAALEPHTVAEVKPDSTGRAAVKDEYLRWAEEKQPRDTDEIAPDPDDETTSEFTGLLQTYRWAG